MSGNPAAGVIVVSQQSVPLWSLSGEERIRRCAGQCHLPVLTMETLPSAGTVLLVRADCALELRVFRALADAPGTLLVEQGTPLAAHCRVDQAPEMAIALLAGDVQMPDLVTGDARRIVGGYQERLRNVAAPVAAMVTPRNSADIEQRLYRGAYKSVTDLITKWLWPKPAAAAVRICARWRISPNSVTLLSLALVILAAWLFQRGEFAAGLVAGWLMTFLDTVDGKLARVTVTSSRFGDILDHGIDLLHPPFWYWAWAIGLGMPALAGLPMGTVVGLIFAGYIVGRLAEGAFQLWCAPFSMFSWRPFDSLNRLITARRNPCMILLTIAIAAGRPDLGLVAVLIWTLLSSLLLWIRVLQALPSRGRLSSWLDDATPRGAVGKLAARWFL